MPHFLKESQYRWYLIGYDTDGKLKSFGVDRISAINILEDTHFLRDEHIDIPSLFRESYGIWNNPEDPVEEIVLKYDSVDGAFVKTLPLHHSQQILSEDKTGITVKLRLRITNDFVMELLSRSRSVEVVAPHTLRTRLYDTLDKPPNETNLLKQSATKYRKSLTIRIKYNTPRLVITKNILYLCLVWFIHMT